MLLLGLLIAVCLLVGTLIGVATGSLVEVDKPATATSARSGPTPQSGLGSVAGTPGPQKSLLLVGVNDTSAAGARLETCWVITFLPGIPEYYVFGFPPSASFTLASLPAARTLSEIYAEDQRLQLGNRFLRDAITTRFPALAIEADLVLDRADLIRLVDELGGLALETEPLGGPELFAAYDAVSSAHSAGADAGAMAFQGQVAGALFALLAERQWTAGQLVDFLRHNSRIGSDPIRSAALDAFVVDAPPLADSKLIWRTFGPEMETPP